MLICLPGPILLGSHSSDKQFDNVDWHDLPRHKDEDQVQLDVNRSFVYYPESKILHLL